MSRVSASTQSRGGGPIAEQTTGDRKGKIGDHKEDLRQKPHDRRRQIPPTLSPSPPRVHVRRGVAAVLSQVEAGVSSNRARSQPTHLDRPEKTAHQISGRGMEPGVLTKCGLSSLGLTLRVYIAVSATVQRGFEKQKCN
ncbi:unnamed protein product [Pleuronectes platessa]|uniref:Uncharacterized protein n=1 Tax=Pleuronectes platessa TaxID=8262 RepID=A0A9N7TWT4_PLEPL|nr:unnamed protein product [Pleuronectes platessa]